MTYSLSLITTLADCDALIESAQRQKKDIEFRKISQERQYETVADNTTSVEASLAGVVAELSGLELAAPTMPDGPIKDQMIIRITTLTYKKFLLENRKVKFGLFAKLEKEYELTNSERELEENANYIAALTARKAEL